MRILILGGDGFCGWPTVLHLAKAGHAVAVVDNLARRAWDVELGTESLVPIATLEDRVAAWQAQTGQTIAVHIGDLQNYDFLGGIVRDFAPEAIVHYAEQRSAPYSMIDREHAVFTQVNNVVGTLNLLYAMKQYAPDAHLIKLGTMGEYGTPNIDIEEGYIEIEHNGRKDVLPYPKLPGSFYHACYDDQTQVLTKRGWKHFADLDAADEVATRQLDDAHLVYAKPTARMEYLYEGAMYRVEQQRLDLCVTPNHRMVTSSVRSDGTEALRFEEASTLLDAPNRYHLTTEWGGQAQTTFTLPAFSYLDDGVTPTTKPAIDIRMNDWLTFLGWYIAAGTLDGQLQQRSQGKITIVEKTGPRAALVSTILDTIADAIGGKHTVHQVKDRGEDVHYLFSTQLAVYLAKLGLHAEMSIPRELLNLPTAQLRILFDLLTEGYTHTRKTDRATKIFVTSSRRLADDVQEIALKIGLSAQISVSDRSQDGSATGYRVTMSRNTIVTVNQQPDTPNDWQEAYTGMVYCCEVPGDGIILVRRNGKPVWCGNSKVHDSTNIHFACRIWGIRATDLHQGVVYNVDTVETAAADVLANRYDYDGIFGTALNRFCSQAAKGYPLTVHGTGGQTRGFIDIRDTVRCIELAALNPAERGEMRVYNQFTEQWSVLQLAERVHQVAKTMGLETQIDHVVNPRVEKEEHYFNAHHTKLLDLGLQPHLLSDETIHTLLTQAVRYRERINLDRVPAQVQWK